MKRAVKILAVITTVGMFLVLVAGATVTNTGSEHGCGKSWPLCHGKLIPRFAVSTAIEYIHRADAAMETVLILALAAGVWYLYRRRREVRILVPLMVAFLFLQAGLGAWAVMYPQLAPVLALHFGVSLVAFASVLLTTVFLFEIDGTERLRDRLVPRPYFWYVWLLAIYTYVVVYSGAYVRHTNADDACKGWPLCNGSVIPAFHGKVASMFGHRLGAGLLTLGVIVLFLWGVRLRQSRPDLFRAGSVALLLVVLQALAGAVVVWTNMDLFAALAHAATVGLFFGTVTYLCIHVLPRSIETTAAAPAPIPAQTTGIAT
ncbi:MAG: COX15/CtaA family protein [Chloroflexota bacterium]